MVAFAGTLLLSLAASATPVRTPHVEAELVADRTAIVPGKPLTVALRLSMDRGWHTYWQNAGDSGLPTTLAWTLPPGISAGSIQWPTPQPLPVGPLLNYGYEGEVLLLTDLTVAPGFAPAVEANATSATAGKSVAVIAARADWLVCKETCIPEGADLTLTLPVAGTGGGEPDSRWGRTIAETRNALPRPLSGWKVSAAGRWTDGGTDADTGSADCQFRRSSRFAVFAFKEGQIEASGVQTLARDGQQWKLALPVANQRVGEFTRVAGVLVTAASGKFAADADGARAAVIDTPLVGAIVAGTAPAPVTETLLPRPASVDNSASLSLGLALAFAFVGGLLLNLMPCVFPVLSLKVLGFAAQGGGRAAMRKHGLAFSGGVLASFWLLAAMLIQLRAAGQQLGWGFQLQSPAVIVTLALLFFVMALNLSGVFEIRKLLPSSMTSWNARNPYVNDALSGVLAVVIASPCSAPFMGAALGYALVGSPSSTWVVFTALGLGMAAPYLLLALFPAWRAKLPKPGLWMIRLKQLLAFPLYATVIWLIWVLGAQLGNDAVARIGLALLLIALALWMWQIARDGGRSIWGLGTAAGIVAALVIAWPVAVASLDGTSDAPSVRASATSGPWQPYAPDRVAQLIGAGQPVFIDFTAAWCVTCQINKGLVLNTDVVQEAFARSKVALVRADWTRRDATIGAALAALGRDGVPVYVLYRPGKEPLLLPEVLRRQDILDAIAPLAVTQGEPGESRRVARIEGN